MAKAINGLRFVVIGQGVELIIRPFLALLLVGPLLLLRPELRQPQVAMAAQLVAALFALIVGSLALFQLLPRECLHADAEYRSQDWLRRTLPFTLIGGASILNNQADVIMLGWFTSADTVGRYRVAVQGSTLVSFSLQAIYPVLAPQIARLYAQGDFRRLQRLVTLSARLSLVAALPLGAAFVFAGDAILGWVFGAEYQAGHLALALLTCAQLVNTGFGPLGFLINMTGHEASAARILWQATFLNIMLNFALIPPFGASGAASASALSLVTWRLLLYRETKSRLGISSTPI